MKSFAAVVTLCALAAATGAADAAATSTTCRNGQPCTNAQGQASRCDTVGKCLSNLTPCPSSSALLQRCHRVNPEFCYPLFDNSTLQCLDLTDIDPIVSRDACTGKPDGAKCVYAYSDMNGPSLDTATVFELEGVCDASECLGTIHSSCMNKELSAACTYETIEKGKLVRFSGTCRSRGLNLMNRCESVGAATVLGDAKVLATSPVTPAPSASKTPPSSSSSSSEGAGSVGSGEANPFDSIWTRTLAPYTFAPYVPETPRPPSYTYTSSSDSGSDPTIKIVLGVLGGVVAVVMFFVRQARKSSAEAEAAAPVAGERPHTPGVDAAYTKLEAGGAQHGAAAPSQRP